jgi:hypothetical protein
MKANNKEWERGIGVAEPHASGPVRVIPVTAAVLDAEARRHQARDTTAIEWRAKLGMGPAIQRPTSNIHTANYIKQPNRSAK